MQTPEFGAPCYYYLDFYSPPNNLNIIFYIGYDPTGGVRRGVYLLGATYGDEGPVVDHGYLYVS